MSSFSGASYCATAVHIWAIRQTEGWGPGSILAGVVIAVLVAWLIWTLAKKSVD